MSLVALALLAFGPATILAEDEQTREHEQQDRRYLERYRQQTAEREAEPAEPQTDRAAFIARAEELIRDRNYRSASSDRYRVQTDDPRLDPRRAVELLEGFRGFFEGFWAERIELRPLEAQARVFLFYSSYKYNQLIGADLSRHPIRPKGHYLTLLDLVAAHTDAEGEEGPANSLIHEAAHQLLDQRLFSPDRRPPRWVVEGLASYFGYTLQGRDGSFRAGQIGGKSVELLEGVRRARDRETKLRLQALRQALRSPGAGDATPLEELIGQRDPAGFDGGRSDLSYGLSWALVHFLLHGDDGAHAAAFVRYIELEASGVGGADPLLAELRMDLGTLDAAVRAHVKKMG